MDAHAYCRDKVAAEGSALYYGLLFVPDPARRALTALRALGEELIEVTDACSDINVGRAKLAWWSEEVLWTLEGKPRHPVTQALTGALDRDRLDEPALRALLQGASARLDAGGYASRDEMDRVIETSDGELGALIAKVCAAGEAGHVAFERKLHAALAHARIARNPRRHGWRSFTYLPADELARHAVTREDVDAGQTSQRLRGAVTSQATHAREKIDAALALLPQDKPEPHLPFLAEAKMERATLDALTRSGGRVLEKSPMITPVRKLWIAWRTAKRMGM